MAHTVIHRPRVAWDAAMAFVRAAAGAEYDAFAAQVLYRLGAVVSHELDDTRARLLDYQAIEPGDQFMSDLEAGRWRARLDDLMMDRPDTVGTIIELTH